MKKVIILKLNKVAFPIKKISQKKLRKIIIISGWSLLALSVSVGVYNGLTKVDTVTNNETKIIKEVNVDNSGVRTFVENFAKTYFSYSNGSEEKSKRQESLKQYLTEDLQSVNTINLSDVSDVQTASSVQSVQIWDISPKEEKQTNKEFIVYFTVEQKVNDKLTKTAYKVDVYKDKESFLIVKNPSVSSLPKKAIYTTKKDNFNHDLKDMKELNKIEDFLNTFFKIYPSASKKEIVYYVKDNSIHEINKNYDFIEINQLTISKEKDGYSTHFFVVYKDKDTQLKVANEYNAIVEKDANSNNYIIKELN